MEFSINSDGRTLRKTSAKHFAAALKTFAENSLVNTYTDRNVIFHLLFHNETPLT